MTKDFLKLIGERIRDVRSYRYKNSIATKAGINPSQLTKIEQGEVNFRIQTLERLAEALEVEPIELLPQPETQEKKKDK